MKGLELSYRYWQEVALPEIRRTCPTLAYHAAFGLVGEGSDCFGYDDAISRDHDWGPGFCIWLTDADDPALMAEADALYRSLPAEFLGFRRLRQLPQTAGRVGVQTVTGFYSQFLGIDRLPETDWDWFRLPEYGLAAATNGQVFLDQPGVFSHWRRQLLAYYPEDVRRKKLAAHCALAAQAGQYNYARCRSRGEAVAAHLALSQFIEHILAALFLLNRTYRPYYKWTARAARSLPILGAAAVQQLEAMVQDPMNQTAAIEQISQSVILALQAQQLSDHPSDFLLHHAEQIQAGIRSPQLRALHLMVE